MRCTLGITVVWTLCLLVGCSGESQQQKSNAPEKAYEIKGKVVDVAPDKLAVTVDHEDIPGLMKAMKMRFVVQDSKLLEGIQSGDHIRGRLKVEGSKYIVTELKKD